MTFSNKLSDLFLFNTLFDLQTATVSLLAKHVMSEPLQKIRFMIVGSTFSQTGLPVIKRFFPEKTLSLV